MSVNDDLVVKWNERRGMWYIAQGNETFYDRDMVWIEFATREGALVFAEKKAIELGVSVKGDRVIEGNIDVCAYGDQMRMGI